MKKADQRLLDTDEFVGTDQEYEKTLTINEILEADNVATLLSQEDLIKIGEDAVCGYTNDLRSRGPWEENLEKWTKLTLQISDNKTYPWPGAANIKFPLLATAAMQFAARAYPTLIPSNGKIVKCKVSGYDETGEKAERAERISKHMSYQVIDEMPDWEEDMDKLLLSLPIVGTCFKKTYWDAAKQVNVSKLVLPKYLVVDYATRSLEEAERITEVFYLTKRQVKERINKGIFLDIDLGSPTESQTMKRDVSKEASNVETSEDETTPYPFLEQHMYLDLDGDGYTEPYVATIEENSRRVVRIMPRYTSDDVQMNDKEEVVCIEPNHFYTKYSFIPNPDGGFYDIGFGRLLGPINESANTIINQLVDAGSLANLQAGFIGKGLRIRMGETRFQPGEWKAVNATGDDIKKQIFPLPTKDPSDVLFKLLDLLLKSGKELASVAEIFVGKMPGQNTPATTTMATIEQGMKVFTAVYKRVYRSLTKEFRKIYKLNKTYLNPEEYIAVLDITTGQEDYQGPEDDVIPGADPTATSSQEKQQKVQAIMQILQLGTIDPMKVTIDYLEAHDVAQAESYLRQPNPQPDPKVEAMKMKAQIDQQKAQNDIQMAREKMRLDSMTKEQELAHKAKIQQMELQGKQMEGILKGREAHQRMIQSDMEHRMGLQQSAQQNQLALRNADMQAKQKQQQQKKVSKEK